MSGQRLCRLTDIPDGTAKGFTVETAAGKLDILVHRGGSIVEVTGNAKDIHQDCLLACSISTPSLASLSRQPRGVLGFIAKGSLRQRRTTATGPTTRK